MNSGAAKFISPSDLRRAGRNIPLIVQCEQCWADAGDACTTYRSPGGSYNLARKPHGVRVRSAARYLAGLGKS